MENTISKKLEIWNDHGLEIILHEFRGDSMLVVMNDTESVSVSMEFSLNDMQAIYDWFGEQLKIKP